MLKGGVFGFGHVGQTMTRRINKEDRCGDDVRIVAACNRGKAKRDIAEKEYNLAAYETIDDLISHGLDFILLVSNSQAHHDSAVKCARAGIPFLIEKPLGTDAAQCREFIELLGQTRAKCMVGYCFRFNPTVLRARDYVVAEYSLAHVMGQDSNSRPRYIVENLGHALDLLFYFHRSEPVEMFATGEGPCPRPLAQVGRMTVTVRFENDTLATVVTGQHAATEHLPKWYFKTCGRGGRTGLRRYRADGKRESTDYKCGRKCQK